MMRRFVLVAVLSGMAGAFTIGSYMSQAQPPAGEKKPRARKRADASVPADSKDRVSLDAARDKAAQLHSIFESTLHAMHRNYFHREKERNPVPARAMQEIFSDLGRESHIDVRWISANTKAMSLDNEPQDEFERLAAKAISAGKDSFDRVENGSYRRAGAIVLGGSCITCHAASTFGPPPTTPRYAGLVISLPVVGDENAAFRKSDDQAR
jgi:cytochrome c553